MNEQEWLACSNPIGMLRVLFGGKYYTYGAALPAKGSAPHRPNDRKARLFCCACFRRMWPLLKDERSRRAVVIAERFADGMASAEELHQADILARDAWLDLSESEFGGLAYLAWGANGYNPFDFVRLGPSVIPYS